MKVLKYRVITIFRLFAVLLSAPLIHCCCCLWLILLLTFACAVHRFTVSLFIVNSSSTSLPFFQFAVLPVHLLAPVCFVSYCLNFARPSVIFSSWRKVWIGNVSFAGRLIPIWRFLPSRKKACQLL